MRIAYCDCFSGISGDMFLGALIDAGVPLTYLREQLSGLDLPDGFELTAEEVKKGALRACQVSVAVSESHHHRHMSDIEAIIQRSKLSEKAKKTALNIFSRLAAAEGQVHGIPAEQVHFHEVGAVDSIVDILGAAAGLDYLGIEKLYASPLPVGSGQVQTQHGLIPLPAPATLELLKSAQAQVVPSQATIELVTPTGAAILAALAEFRLPAFQIEASGTGAGKKELPWPNIMRLIIGETGAQAAPGYVLIETNIDDMNPEIFGHAMHRLFHAGALDVFFTSIVMKKNRPATQLSVIARASDEQALARILLEETSTFGVRVQSISRYEAQREMRTVQSEYGEIPVKIKMINGRARQAVPEFDACARLAEERGVPLIEIYTAAQAAGAALLEQ